MSICSLLITKMESHLGVMEIPIINDFESLERNGAFAIYQQMLLFQHFFQISSYTGVWREISLLEELSEWVKEIPIMDDFESFVRNGAFADYQQMPHFPLYLQMSSYAEAWQIHFYKQRVTHHLHLYLSIMLYFVFISVVFC